MSDQEALAQCERTIQAINAWCLGAGYEWSGYNQFDNILGHLHVVRLRLIRRLQKPTTDPE